METWEHATAYRLLTTGLPHRSSPPHSGIATVCDKRCSDGAQANTKHNLQVSQTRSAQNTRFAVSRPRKPNESRPESAPTDSLRPDRPSHPLRQPGTPQPLGWFSMFAFFLRFRLVLDWCRMRLPGMLLCIDLHIEFPLSEEPEVLRIIKGEPLYTGAVLNAEVASQRLVDMLRVNDRPILVVALERLRIDFLREVQAVRLPD